MNSFDIDLTAGGWLTVLVILSLIGFKYSSNLATVFTASVASFRPRLTESKQSALVLGTGITAQRLLQNISQARSCLDFAVQGYLPIPGEQELICEEKLIREDSKLSQLLDDRQCKIIVVAMDKKLSVGLMQQLLDCKLNGTTLISGVSLLPEHSIDAPQSQSHTTRLGNIAPSPDLFA